MKPVLTRRDLISAICRKVGLSPLEASFFLEETLKTVAEALAKGEDVKLCNFGRFVVHDKGERIARNPKTGEPAKVAARRSLTFKASDKLKEQINNG